VFFAVLFHFRQIGQTFCPEKKYLKCLTELQSVRQKAKKIILPEIGIICHVVSFQPWNHTENFLFDVQISSPLQSYIHSFKKPAKTQSTCYSIPLIWNFKSEYFKIHSHIQRFQSSFTYDPKVSATTTTTFLHLLFKSQRGDFPQSSHLVCTKKIMRTTAISTKDMDIWKLWGWKRMKHWLMKGLINVAMNK